MRLFNRIFKRTLASPRNRLASALLNLNFLSGNLDNRITFGRPTNATVTNAQGLVANAPMNLLTFSEQFDNAVWTKRGTCTVTANAFAAPDGTTTADLVTGLGSLGSNDMYFGGTVSGSPATTTVLAPSFYIKKVSSTGTLRLQNAGGNTYGVWLIDLSLLSTAWERITPAHPAVTVSTTYTGTGGSTAGPQFNATAGTLSFYIWGAQLELGSTATTYNPTTVKNLLGFTENFDNAAWTKSNAFVQTNLLLQSEAFDSASWSGVSFSVTANATTAPNGTATADKVIASAASSQHYILQNVSIAANGTYTASFYAKSSEYTSFDLWLLNAATADRAVASFNLAAGTTTSSTAGGAPFTGQSSTITDVGNGWYRCTLTATSTGGAINLQSRLFPSSSATYTGNGTSGMFIWGAQLVQGTSAGDYKATYAAAAAVGYTDIYGQPFAQKLVEDTALAGHFVLQSAAMIAGTSYTASVYAKQGERRWVFVRFVSGGAFAANHIAIFDLQNGTAVADSGNPPASFSITNVGNGWYRCSITQAAASTGTGSLGVFTSANGVTSTYTGDGTSGIYIFGAQLSDSASVDPYVYNPVAAPSSVAYYGPRFDYDPVTLAPKGLLIEEQRTNLLTYSEQVDNAVWTKASVTATANTTVSPDGTANAETLTENTTGGEHVAFQQVSKAATAITYTHSIYYKTGSGSRNIGVAITDGTLGGLTAIFSTSGSVVLASQVVGTATGWTAVGAAVTAVGNGWFRASFTATTNTATRVDGVVYLVDGTTRSYTGNGTSSLLIYGAQLEAGAFATSYIPTVASQVTRAADSASMIGNNFARWYNQTQGTVYAEFLLNSTAGTFPSAYSINDGTANNRIQPYQNSALTSIGFDITTGGAAQAAINITVPSLATAYVRHAGVYQTNSAVAAANGTLGTEDTSVTLAPYNRLGLGSNSLAQNANCWIKRFAYYPRRLSNTELQGITS